MVRRKRSARSDGSGENPKKKKGAQRTPLHLRVPADGHTKADPALPRGSAESGRDEIQLDEYHVRMIERMAAYGLRRDAIAWCVGVSPVTFRRMRKRDARIDAAIHRGLSNGERRVGMALYKKAISGDLGSCIWWEKTRLGRWAPRGPYQESTDNVREQAENLRRALNDLERRIAETDGQPASYPSVDDDDEAEIFEDD